MSTTKKIPIKIKANTEKPINIESQNAPKVDLNMVETKIEKNKSEQVDLSGISTPEKFPGLITKEGYHLDKLNNEQLKVFFYVLIKYIYDTTKIEYIVYDGLKYYNRSNMWYSRPRGVSASHDPNFACAGYEFCNFGFDEYKSKEHSNMEKETESEVPVEENHEDEIPVESCRLFVNDDKKIEYHLSYCKEDSQLDYFDESSPLEAEFYDLIDKSLTSLSDMKLICGKEIHLYNHCGENEDHRGSDHTKIILDFHDHYILNSNCSLQQFADACYRVKSHKFDYWYELYSDAQIMEQTDTYYIDISFDHGS